MIQKLGGVLLIVAALVVLALWFYAPGGVPYVLSFLLFLVAALWFYKAFMELGMDSVRGQFYAVMALAFVFQGIGFTFTNVNNVITLSFIGIIAYILARFFFFVANLRYIVYFQSLGYRLNPARAALVVVFTLFFTVLTFFIPNVANMFLRLSPYLIFILLDVGMVFIVIYNLLLLWGSEIAKKWAIGSVVIVSFLMGDALFIGGAEPWTSIAFWTLASTLMGIIATIRG
jgi:hypothetical protein